MMSDMEVLKRLGLYKKIYDNCPNQERFLYNIEKRKSMCDSSLGYRLAYYIDDLFIWGRHLKEATSGVGGILYFFILQMKKYINSLQSQSNTIRT